MLWVVIGLRGDGHYYIPLCHFNCCFNSLVHLRDMLQNFQKCHHIEAVFRKGLVTDVFVTGCQLAVAACSQFVQKCHPLVQQIHGSYLHLWKFFHKGKQEYSPPAAHIQQGFKFNAMEKT